jgi:hypothetical protein
MSEGAGSVGAVVSDADAGNQKPTAGVRVVRRLPEAGFLVYCSSVVVAAVRGLGPSLSSQNASSRGLATMVLALVALPAAITLGLLVARHWSISPKSRRLWYLGIATACGAMALSAWNGYTSTFGADYSVFPSPGPAGSASTEFLSTLAGAQGAAQLRLDDLGWACVLGIAAALAGACALEAQLEKNEAKRRRKRAKPDGLTSS